MRFTFIFRVLFFIGCTSIGRKPFAAEIKRRNRF